MFCWVAIQLQLSSATSTWRLHLFQHQSLRLSEACCLAALKLLSLAFQQDLNVEEGLPIFLCPSFLTLQKTTMCYNIIPVSHFIAVALLVLMLPSNATISLGSFLLSWSFSSLFHFSAVSRHSGDKLLYNKGVRTSLLYQSNWSRYGNWALDLACFLVVFRWNS